MAKERRIITVAFTLGTLFYVLKQISDPEFTINILTTSTYLLLLSASLTVLVSINHLKLLYDYTLGFLAFAVLNLGILLAGTHGLQSSSHSVIEGLSRITLATFTIWKLSSDMRHLDLLIDPHRPERSRFSSIFFGILFPPREFLRLVKVLVFVAFSFYLVYSGLDILSQSAIDLVFFEETEKLAINVVFFGIQVPMMMASRASISKTFSNYLKNLEWARMATENTDNMHAAYMTTLQSSDLTYDTITSNGKHLWLTMLLTLILQAYQDEIVALDLFKIDYIGFFKRIILSIHDLIVQLLGN